ncbi:hypothetical protein Agub_g4804, partial [Astrephomene gubernaculifera]
AAPAGVTPGAMDVGPRGAGLLTALTPAQLNDLFDALDDEAAHEMVQYARLFEDDTDLSQGVFVETLRQQHLHNRLDWFQSIEDAVLDWAEAGGHTSLGPTSLRNAMMRAHPDTDTKTQREMLTRVFGAVGGAVVLPPGEKPTRGSRAARLGKDESAVAVPLEVALRKLRQERSEGMVGAAAALEMIASGRVTKSAAGRGGSPRRGGRAANQ